MIHGGKYVHVEFLESLYSTYKYLAHDSWDQISWNQEKNLNFMIFFK